MDTYQNKMIARALRKLKFLSLRSSVGTFEQFKKIKPFDRLDPALLDASKARLRPYFDHYIKEISRADMAASLELAAFMFTICKLKDYSRLLDMGSGFSSFVFRLYAKETSGVTVCSVDDDTAWLEKTKKYLMLHDLDTSNLLPLDEFLETGATNFDCILHDLNFVDVRIKYVDRIWKRCAREGLVVFDDVHKPDYLLALLSELKNLEARTFSLEAATRDQFGRFALAATRET